MNTAEKTGAFFDLDGTLLALPSLEWRFFHHLAVHGHLSASSLVRWLDKAMANAGRNWREATAGNKAYLAGVPCAAAQQWGRTLAEYPLPFYTEALRRVEWHAAQRHMIFVITGALSPLAAIALGSLGLTNNLTATELETLPGLPERWSGTLRGPWFSGAAKARALAELAAKHRLSLARSHAYGDSRADSEMLSLVGHPAVVNPGPRFEWNARERNWEVLRWNRQTAGNAAANSFPRPGEETP